HLAGDLRHRGVVVAVWEPMCAVQWIDDQQRGSQRQHSGNDGIPVWKNRAIFAHRCKADLASTSAQNANVADCETVVDAMVYAGGGDAPVPFVLIVLVADDR